MDASHVLIGLAATPIPCASIVPHFPRHRSPAVSTAQPAADQQIRMLPVTPRLVSIARHEGLCGVEGIIRNEAGHRDRNLLRLWERPPPGFLSGFPFPGRRVFFP